MESISQSILLVEDDRDLAANIEEYLARRGWSVQYSANGARALDLILTDRFAAVILDHQLPGLTGMEICQKLRAGIAQQLPVLMLTAADSLEDRLAGFAAGVDDYLVKPFALPELEARLRALIRRAEGRPALAAARLIFEDVEMDLSRREVLRAGRPLQLTRMAFAILEILLRRAPAIVTREELERTLWGEELPGSDALRSHIFALRANLERAPLPPLLQTHRGVGYQLQKSASKPLA
jgi:DNA-binding response OmpR family regulator